MALRASGRSIVQTAIGPSRSNDKYGVPSQSPSGGRGLSGVGAFGVTELLSRRLAVYTYGSVATSVVSDALSTT